MSTNHIGKLTKISLIEKTFSVWQFLGVIIGLIIDMFGSITTISQLNVGVKIYYSASIFLLYLFLLIVGLISSIKLCNTTYSRRKIALYFLLASVIGLLILTTLTHVWFYHALEQLYHYLPLHTKIYLEIVLLHIGFLILLFLNIFSGITLWKGMAGGYTLSILNQLSQAIIIKSALFIYQVYSPFGIGLIFSKHGYTFFTGYSNALGAYTLLPHTEIGVNFVAVFIVACLYITYLLKKSINKKH